MALREVRLEGDPILRKKSKEIREITDRIKVLLEDMVETMNHENGVGLAAPQVGILRRAIVLDIGEGPIKMINPVISSEKGKIIEAEGCLSVPGRSGTVQRPESIRVEYTDIDGKETSIKAEGLMARAICHEVDHLNGILYIDKIIEEIELEDLEDETGDII